MGILVQNLELRNLPIPKIPTMHCALWGFWFNTELAGGGVSSFTSVCYFAFNFCVDGSVGGYFENFKPDVIEKIVNKNTKLL